MRRASQGFSTKGYLTKRSKMKFSHSCHFPRFASQPFNFRISFLNPERLINMLGNCWRFRNFVLLVLFRYNLRYTELIKRGHCTRKRFVYRQEETLPAARKYHNDCETLIKIYTSITFKRNIKAVCYLWPSPNAN